MSSRLGWWGPIVAAAAGPLLGDPGGFPDPDRELGGLSDVEDDNARPSLPRFTV